MTGSRRGLLVLGGTVTLIYGLRVLPWDRLPGRGPRYVDLPDLPPFRRLEEDGQTSGATVALIGLDAPTDDADQRRARADALRADLCPALFGPAVPTEIVPIAYFSEFRCLWRDNLCEKSATIRMRVVVVAAGSGWPHGDQRSSGFAS